MSVPWWHYCPVKIPSAVGIGLALQLRTLLFSAGFLSSLQQYHFPPHAGADSPQLFRQLLLKYQIMKND